MFKINRASGMKLFRAYKHQGKITCTKGKDENPISFYTTNLAFVGDGTAFTVKSKFGANKNALISFEKYLKSNMPYAFSA